MANAIKHATGISCLDLLICLPAFSLSSLQLFSNVSHFYNPSRLICALWVKSKFLNRVYKILCNLLLLPLPSRDSLAFTPTNLSDLTKYYFPWDAFPDPQKWVRCPPTILSCFPYLLSLNTKFCETRAFILLAVATQPTNHIIYWNNEWISWNSGKATTEVTEETLLLYLRNISDTLIRRDIWAQCSYN